MMNFRVTTTGQRGVSLLEVLVAIVVFAVGLLAIASLQGNLMRSGSEAKARSVATSLAEDRIEEARAFLNDNDFDDLVGDVEDVVESGVEFRREMTVTDYHYAVDGSGLAQGANPATGDVELKMVSLAVSWCDAQSGPECTPTDTDAAHTVVVEDVVSRSASPVGSARALQQVTNSRPPRVPYAPGEAPSTISIDLGDGNLRESPEPELTTTRSGSDDSEEIGVNTITRLSAITYNTLDTGEVVSLQQQEFLAANCTCAFGTDPDRPAERNIGHTPAVWDGDNWVGRIQVDDKPVGRTTLGSSAGSQRRTLCADCCRDHHDASGGTTFEFTYVDQDGNSITDDVPVAKYNPFRDAGKEGNHDHFNGSMELVTSGTYLEACRLARVDGNFILSTDFRLENLKVLPALTDRFADDDKRQPFHDWIGDSDGGYQKFVQDFVEIYADVVAGEQVNYPTETPARDDPDTDEEEGPLPHGLDSPYNLPTTDETPGNDETRTLVARAIYIDFLHPILQDRINCRLGSGANCRERDVEEDDEGNLPAVLPLVPFWEVNVALQANWAEVGRRPQVVEVTNEPVADDGEYTRGEVTLADANGVSTDVVASIEQGNIGLTDTHNITPFEPPDDAEFLCHNTDRLFIDRLTYEGTGTAGESGHIVEGCFVLGSDLIEENVIAPSDVEVIDAFGNDCSGTFEEGVILSDHYYQCEIQATDVDDGTNVIVVGNYSTNQVDNTVCLGPLPDGGFDPGTVEGTGKGETTTFDFGANDQDWNLNLRIVRSFNEADNCPPGQLK